MEEERVPYANLPQHQKAPDCGQEMNGVSLGSRSLSVRGFDSALAESLRKKPPTVVGGVSLIVFLLTFIAINLFILDLKVFSPQENVRISDISTIVTPLSSPNSSAATTNNNNFCPQSCLSVIKEATRSNLAVGGPEPTPTSIQYQSVISTAREFYIPLGSGSTTKSDWEDLTATETVIDPANYQTIKEAYFIASLHNPTQNGQVEAQLYNVTSKHPVWGSHVIMNGPTSQTITSGKITLDTGSKLYRVQLKSGMQYPVFLEGAKLRIIAE